MCRHGAPRVLLSDQGTNFLSKLVSEICQIVGTKQIKTSSYHPETDGLVERFNKTLATMISMYVSERHKDWDEFLPLVLFAYRTSLHDSVKDTPFFLLYGRDAKLPLDQVLDNPYRVLAGAETYRVSQSSSVSSCFIGESPNSTKTIL